MSDRPKVETSVATVADALALAALPDRARRLLADEVRAAYLAGFTAGSRTARADARTGLVWADVPQYPALCAELYVGAAVGPLLGVPGGD